MDYIHFTPEQITQARKVNLYNYMISQHPGDVQKCGNGVIQLKAHDSLKIKQGWTGFYRHSTGDHGDAIYFLREYYGYTFHEAVLELLGSSCHLSSLSDTPLLSNSCKKHTIPLKKQGFHKNVMAYLCSRGISSETVNKLIEAELLYQDIRNNAVFINKSMSFAELKGTYTYGNKVFRQTLNLAGDKSLYWSFNADGAQSKNIAYITESAIDAVSLYELHKNSGNKEVAAYCSCSGVSRADAIAQIIKDYKTAIIAVDNDEAGNKCALRYPKLNRITPIYKDWNADLISHKNRADKFIQGVI